MSLAPDDPRHGTINGYNNLRCRCERCVKAGRAYMREAMYRRELDEPCTFDGCEVGQWAKGLCHAHYMQRQRGTPLRPYKRRWTYQRGKGLK